MKHQCECQRDPPGLQHSESHTVGEQERSLERGFLPSVSEAFPQLIIGELYVVVECDRTAKGA